MITASRWVELEELVCPACGNAVQAGPAKDLPGQEFAHTDGSALCDATPGLAAQPVEARLFECVVRDVS
jgi:hypothetical protein